MTPQRAYRAACPNCGAPVEFASAASASAVCSFCRSTLVRDGEALERIGIVGELFDDHSPLQLGVRGERQGVAFTLVGRLQYGYAGGTWNEWHALFDNGRSAWLSEDNGAYVIAFDAPLPADAPTVAALRAGQRVLADGRAWDVASVVSARLIAAQGELPTPPRLDGEFSVADLRNGAGEVATIDASNPERPAWSVGRSVLLSELALQGLKDAAEKMLAARGVECPSCGAALEVRLATTQSITCTQCNAVVDLSAGVGGELAHYAQNNSGRHGDFSGLEPQIPLGSSGTLALDGPPLPWQVVGYLERCDEPADSEEETTYWREYLLYHREAGFAFLVDSPEDGWSWVRPITGVPQRQGERMAWQGATYRQKWAYPARVTWVQGEFYWRVRRDERAHVTDYQADAGRQLSREQVGNEVTWSAGRTLDATAVAKAFGIAPAAHAAMQRDVKPVSFSGIGFKHIVYAVVIIVVLVAMLSTCSSDDCDDVRRTFGAASTEYQQCQQRAGSSGYRSGGGSYGGWSSGGSHK